MGHLYTEHPSDGPKEKKSIGFRSGEYGAQTKLVFRLITRSPQVSRQPVVSDVLSTAAKAHFEFIQDGDVSLGDYRLTISIIVLKEKRPDDSLTAHSSPDSYLFRMQLFTDTRFYPILYLLLKSLL